ncbi:DUF4097 family beta strand repeat-containing protein [Hymenobacter glacialis]|uniref:Adhesin domain-containing protein n=1 Tax=Hymenobacter glacialis TaxID=1908236 RepID=A0A1G1SYU4_9BACT|nr:hypothetical protein [Hymenobacter glacialis]OGX83779.1 hypothetical protein BEN48_03150 [Hymenobacter glacialis]
MRRLFFLFLLVLAVSGAQPATAQKIVEKTANLAPGQRVFLNLRQATNIRIRSGASGKMTLKASVSINQNKLNDALLLTTEQAGDELKLTSAFDKELLRNAQPGDCPNGGAYYGESYNTTITNGKVSGGHDRDGRTVNQVCAIINYEITVPADVVLRVSTISGDIDIAGLTGAIDAKSISGFVDVTWPPTTGAEVSLKTITGEVYTDQDVAFSNRKDNPIVGYQLRGTLRGSGPLVKLESISNDVYFRKRK